jgi:hypothetical protein
MAQDAARELPNLMLEEALQLVHLYAERRSSKFERSAIRWLERHLSDGSAPAPAIERSVAEVFSKRLRLARHELLAQRVETLDLFAEVSPDLLGETPHRAAETLNVRGLRLDELPAT